MAARAALIRRVTIIIGCYAVLLGGGVRCHWAGEPPYYRPSFGLLIAFATVGALVGLVSIWSAFALVHWSTRASGLIAGTAILAGLLTLFLEWNDYLVWQVVVIVYSQLACLVIALSAFRLCGYTIQCDVVASQNMDEPFSARSSQFTVRNLLVLTSALALLFCVLHYSRPGGLSMTEYAINAIGGVCAAIVSLAVCWACFTRKNFVFRIAALLAVAPAGGIVYILLEPYAPLLMSASWYAGVTTLQVVLMTLPLAIVRSHGYRFTRFVLN